MTLVNFRPFRNIRLLRYKFGALRFRAFRSLSTGGKWRGLLGVYKSAFDIFISIDAAILERPSFLTTLLVIGIHRNSLHPWPFRIGHFGKVLPTFKVHLRYLLLFLLLIIHIGQINPFLPVAILVILFIFFPARLHRTPPEPSLRDPQDTFAAVDGAPYRYSFTRMVAFVSWPLNLFNRRHTGLIFEYFHQILVWAYLSQLVLSQRHIFHSIFTVFVFDMSYFDGFSRADSLVVDRLVPDAVLRSVVIRIDWLVGIDGPEKARIRALHWELGSVLAQVAGVSINLDCLVDRIVLAPLLTTPDLLGGLGVFAIRHHLVLLLFQHRLYAHIRLWQRGLRIRKEIHTLWLIISLQLAPIFLTFKLFWAQIVLILFKHRLILFNFRFVSRNIVVVRILPFF